MTGLNPHRRSTMDWTAMRRIGLRGACLLVISLPALTACSKDFHLSAGTLIIAPNPAGPGDVMSATFILNLLPQQRHTMIVYIDEKEHMRETSDALQQHPVVLVLGSADDLIAEYGTGEHVAYVFIEARGEQTRTDFAAFHLTDE